MDPVEKVFKGVRQGLAPQWARGLPTRIPRGRMELSFDAIQLARGAGELSKPKERPLAGKPIENQSKPRENVRETYGKPSEIK